MPSLDLHEISGCKSILCLQISEEKPQVEEWEKDMNRKFTEAPACRERQINLAVIHRFPWSRMGVKGVLTG